eukprot:TRINITY_DN18722_c0_g1_i1.p1 TRINITY_DN18722_c0_g1~~TRINITY_DN18722_c0_g1_i1.p1  ORF type:complete len:143 (-),score=33.12 TRINITY_DN18722_c0_g1_i1:244-672(-)
MCCVLVCVHPLPALPAVCHPEGSSAVNACAFSAYHCARPTVLESKAHQVDQIARVLSVWSAMGKASNLQRGMPIDQYRKTLGKDQEKRHRKKRVEVRNKALERRQTKQTESNVMKLTAIVVSVVVFFVLLYGVLLALGFFRV